MGETGGIMKKLWLSLGLALWTTTALAQREAAPTQTQLEAREMFAKLIAFPTFEGGGGVPAMAAYLKVQLEGAGFAASDIEIVPLGDSAGFIARYRGPEGSDKKPVLFLAHMDVVTAERADWDYDPFALTEKDGVFYGRGVVDNKYGVLTLTQAFMRLKREGFTPDRDLILVFTGDEETGMRTTRLLAERFKDAAFAVNSDAGGGFIPANGSGAMYGMQAAEKTYATFEVTAANEGGHSSAPRDDNAIYDLADALQRIRTHRFPARWNDVTLASLAVSLPSLDGDLKEAVKRFIANPGDKRALKIMERERWIDNDLRTTCVATMLRAGHAENALPQKATATVNCRIFPGETIEETKAALAAAMGNENLEIAVLDEPLESPVSEVPAELAAALAEAVKAIAPDATIYAYQENGGTDGLHFRRAGVATIGAGPIYGHEGDEYNFHGRNERFPAARFDAGLDHFVLLIKALAGEPAAD